MSSTLKIKLIGNVTQRIKTMLADVVDYYDCDIHVTRDSDAPITISDAKYQSFPRPSEVLIAEVAALTAPTPNPFDCADDKVLYLDIETHNAGEQWSMSPRDFFRLGQWAWGIDGEVHTTTNYDKFMEQLAQAEGMVAHNGHNFDWSVLYGKDSTTPLMLAKDNRLLDTMVWANLAYPAPETYTDRAGHTYRGVSKPEQYKKWLSLDNLAYQMGVEGKWGSLKELATQYNPPKTPVNQLDYGLIPTDDPDFLDYARQDIVALQHITKRLCLLSPMTEYDWREQLCAALNAQITRNGFMVDVETAQGRIDQLAKRREKIMARLVSEFGFPTEGKSPWASNAGKEAIVGIMASYGITPETHEWPRTPKGALKLGGDELKALAEGTEAEEVANAIAEVKGQRSLAQLTLDCTQPDNKVHPDIDDLQRSGRSCLPETHRLLTRRGVVHVNDIRPGEDETIDHRGNWVKVLDVHRYADAPVLSYTSRGLHLEATPEHRWVQKTRGFNTVIKPLAGQHRLLQLTPDAYPFVLNEPFDIGVLSKREQLLVAVFVCKFFGCKDGLICVKKSGIREGIVETIRPFVTSYFGETIKVTVSDEYLSGDLYDMLCRLLKADVQTVMRALLNILSLSTKRGTRIQTLPIQGKEHFLSFALYRCGIRSAVDTSNPRYMVIRQHLVPLRSVKSNKTFNQSVWCVTTETGTFTAVGPDEMIYLTGNSVTRPGLTVWNSRGDTTEKSYFVAEPGHKLVSFDLSNADARAVAAYSGDERYRENFLPGVDNHMNVARMVYGDQPDFVDDKHDPNGAKYRTLAKACIAEGSLVLTDKGLVPIERVNVTDKVWDGVEWVTHGGVVFKGSRSVISYQGLTATPDHLVFVEGGGLVSFEQAWMCKLNIVVSGDGTTPMPHGAPTPDNEPPHFNRDKPYWFKGIALVFDIVNAGPRHRYTVSDRLVHNCGHAWNYGGGASTISRAAGQPLEVAEHFVAQMAKAFPDVVKWRNHMAMIGERDGYITNKWGRKMPIVRDRAYTQSSALMGQSGTREVMKDALIKMLNYDVRLVQWVKVPVHDELIFSIPEEELAWAVPKIEKLMYYNWDGVEFHASHGGAADTWEQATH